MAGRQPEYLCNILLLLKSFPVVRPGNFCDVAVYVASTPIVVPNASGMCVLMMQVNCCLAAYSFELL